MQSIFNISFRFLPYGITFYGYSETLFDKTSSLAQFILRQPIRQLNRDLRRQWKIKRDRPLGPDKIIPPGVKYNGKIGPNVQYRRIIHFPEDGQYTIKKLKITKLGGRDPVTGRKVVEGIGGGSKQLYRWIDWWRLPKHWPIDGPDLLERVVNICYDPVRTAQIALVGHQDKMRWLIATHGMNIGGLLRTSAKIPLIPIRPKDGDSYPLGALPTGTIISCIETYPQEGMIHICDGDQFCRIVRKIGNRVVIKREDKQELSLDERCQCVVGKVLIHPLKALPIGSPNRNRWLGNRPRSGLWKRKTGIHGRKVRSLPSVREVNAPQPPTERKLLLHADSEGKRGALPGKKRPFCVDKW